MPNLSQDLNFSEFKSTDLVSVYFGEEPEGSTVSKMSSKFRGRRESDNKVALVFSGGGNKGAAQAGMLQALVECGLEFDFLVGCSVGALNAAAFAKAPNLEGIKELQELWLTLKADKVFTPGSVFRGLRFAEKRRSVYSNDGLKSIINSVLSEMRFEDLALPVFVGATSFNTADEIWFDRGSLLYPLLASTALPGIFPPISENNMELIDGGVLNDAPISKAIELGAKTIVLLSCNTVEVNKHFPERPIETIIESFGIAISARLKRDLGRLPPGVQVLVGEFPGPYGLDWKDFSHAEHLIKRGYDEMNRFFKLNSL